MFIRLSLALLSFSRTTNHLKCCFCVERLSSQDLQLIFFFTKGVSVCGKCLKIVSREVEGMFAFCLTERASKSRERERRREGAGVGGREEKRRVSRMERGRRASCCLAGAVDSVFECVSVSAA